MEAVLRTVMSESIVDSYILITDEMVEILSEITQFYEVVLDAIENIIAPGAAAVNSLLKVFESEPNTTLAFIKAIADPVNVAHLFQGDMDFTTICLNAVESLSINEITKLTFETNVCTIDVSSEMASLISTMQFQDLNKKMELLIGEMIMIYAGITNPTSKLLIKDLYSNIQNVFSRMAVVTTNFTQMIKKSFTSTMENNASYWNETDSENIPAMYSSTPIQSEYET
ncbi:hypothetical protein CHS0354_023685 [Potamilus streckersoni]|uniref:Uncharacterized protein n=1 Tax=Potamilus streckersoni TaxID=2493646 RepID=A0AAE0SBM7_9BIVA|nr:hypothetical protein CHS0354_023685 [Potamilus streckersoni]